MMPKFNESNPHNFDDVPEGAWVKLTFIGKKVGEYCVFSNTSGCRLMTGDAALFTPYATVEVLPPEPQVGDMVTWGAQTANWEVVAVEDHMLVVVWRNEKGEISRSYTINYQKVSNFTLLGPKGVHPDD
jgi:hypothetical protein